MSRFFVPKDAITSNRIIISGKEAHHILDVMRLKELDKVVAFDGSGKEYIGFIKEIKHKSLIMEIVETRRYSGKYLFKITLIQAIPKKDKMDYIVEKSTELGVHSIQPVVTARTVIKWDERKRSANVDRWRRIAIEASKQCGRADVPIIDIVRKFDDVIKDKTDYDLSLIATLSNDSIKLRDALKGFKGGKLAIAIGPEGDFTPEEINRAKEAKFELVDLGTRVLKSDTAGPAVLAILNYELSN